MRTMLLIASASLLCACAREGLTIYAPAELAQATIFIDSREAGTFQKTQREYRWLGWRKMKEELMNAPRSETIAKLPPIAFGKHELRIVKAGYEPIAIQFTCNAARMEIEIDDALVKAAQPSAVTPHQTSTDPTRGY